MKRLLALLLACLMVVSLFSACSSSSSSDDEDEDTETTEDEDTDDEDADTDTDDEEDSDSSSEVIDHGIMSANGEVPIVEEEMTFNIAVRQVSNVSDYDTNLFVIWLEETTNIVCDYDLLAEDSITEKTNLILASGS